MSAGYVTPPRGEAAPHAQEAPRIGPSARLRIGLMLRAIDEVDGKGIWTRSAETLLSELRAAAGPRRVARAV